MGNKNTASVHHDKEMAHVNRIIEEELQRERETERKKIKLLLLGPGESGKSTVLKQMRLMQDAECFFDAEYNTLRAIIRGNLLQCIGALVIAMVNLKIPYGDDSRESDAVIVLSIYRHEDMDMEEIPLEVAESIKRLWNDSGIQQCHKRSSEFQINDNSTYFLNAIDRICDPMYRPSVADILNARRKTQGIAEVHFNFKNQFFRVFDVAGQRTQRRKWIHCFDNVNSIIYVAAISEYNQFMREDKERNRLHDSIRLFSGMANSQWFRKTHMIVFLNKIDIFKSKLSQCGIIVAFPEYSGSLTYESCLEYVEEKFNERNRIHSRKIYFHRTCATDPGQMQFILDSSIDMISASYVKAAGLY